MSVKRCILLDMCLIADNPPPAPTLPAPFGFRTEGSSEMQKHERAALASRKTISNEPPSHDPALEEALGRSIGREQRGTTASPLVPSVRGIRVFCVRCGQ